MQTAAISGPSSPLGGPARGLGSLKSEDFFRILVTEMRQQDPFEPTKTADMIGQVSQIRGIELNTQLTDTLTNLSRSQRTAGASELLGRYVIAAAPNADGSFAEVKGVVTGVRFNPDGAAVLELDSGEAVLASHVMRVTANAAAAQQQATAAATTPGDSTAAALEPGKTAAARLRLPWLEGVFKL